MFKKCQINAEFKTWTLIIAANEKTIMDHACDYAKNDAEMLKINKVRLWKKMVFCFEIIGSNGKNPLNEFYTHEASCSMAHLAEIIKHAIEQRDNKIVQ